MTKPRSRRKTPTPTPPVATRIGIPMLREAFHFPHPDDDVPNIGHAAMPIIEFRDALSHGGARYQRWLINKARRERFTKLVADAAAIRPTS